MVDLNGGVPILLSADVDLEQGETDIVDAGRLQSQFRSPMMIDSINFQTSVPSLPQQGAAELGGTIRARFRMGRIDISDKFVPIWLHGPRLSDWSVDPEAQGINNSAQAQDDIGYVQHYRWILPTPLYVPAGSVLLPNFSREIDNIPGTVNVNVSYAARRLPVGTPQPKEIDVPFIAAFIGTANASNGWSTARDLYNPFQVPLQVQRFTARLQAMISSLLPDYSIFDATETPNAGPYIRLQDSEGYNVVRTPALLGEVFDVSRRAWTFRRKLEPKQWYTLQYSDLPTQANYTYQVHAAMIGTRKEVFG